MILGFYGFQDSGKTKLVEGLVAALVKKGFSVSSIKHTSHKTSIDSEGKDTWRHWSAGSDPVVFSSAIETSLIKHSEMPIEDIVTMVTTRFNPDVLIVEGCKDGPFPKVAVGNLKPRGGTVMVNPELNELVAYVAHEVAVERVIAELPGLDCGKCGLDCEGLARKIVEGERKLKNCVELSDIDVKITVGTKRIAAGKFVSSIVDNTIRGLLSSLKGYEPGKEVEIRLGSKRRSPRKRSKV